MTNPNSPATTPILAEVPMNATSASATDDWKKKNFYYYEEMTFTAPGEAPNQGQLFLQGCYGLTYEQRVFFAPNTAGVGGLNYQPAVATAKENTLVHYENGLWLHTQFEAQPKGAYGTTLSYPPKDGLPSRSPANPIVKHVSVPHGNSILALGKVATIEGLPVHDTQPLTERPFSLDSSIPNPALVLHAAVDDLKSMEGKILQTTHLSVSTDAASGDSVTNIPFEVGNSDVSGYEMDLWIIDIFNLSDITSPISTVLQDIQKIPMTFSITHSPTPDDKGREGKKETLYHITANTLTKVEA